MVCGEIPTILKSTNLKQKNLTLPYYDTSDEQHWLLIVNALSYV